jgi:hypothetical protein
LIAVQINEVDFVAAQLISEAALREDQISVSLVARSLRHNDTPGTKLAKRLRGGAYEHRIRVHLNSGDVFDEIRFQQDGFISDRQHEQAKRSRQGIGQFFGVPSGGEDRNPRSVRSAVAQEHLFWQELGSRDSSHGKSCGADQGSPSVEFDHTWTPKMFVSSAASSANAQAASVQTSSAVADLSIRVINRFVARHKTSLTSLKMA